MSIPAPPRALRRTRRAALPLGFGVLLALLGAVPASGAPLPPEQGGADRGGSRPRVLESGDVVGDPGVIADGVVLPEGTPWKARGALLFTGTGSMVVLDLGEPSTFAAVSLQADNNDVYRLESSADGSSWELLHMAVATPGAGLRSRHAVLAAPRTARFLRVSPSQGDGSFSISELQVRPDPVADWARRIEVPAGATAAQPFLGEPRWGPAVFGLLLPAFLVILGGFALASGREATPLRLGTLALAVISVMAYGLVTRDDAAFYDAHRYVVHAGWILLVLAALSMMSFRPAATGEGPDGPPVPGRPAARGVLTGILVLLAIGSTASYYNFGKFHGYNYVHYYEFAHYFMGSKYFPELGYHDLYRAFVAVEGEGQKAFVGSDLIRDLNTNELVRIDSQSEHFAALPGRFTPARWEAFRADYGYFRTELDAERWRKVLKDHGYNPSPVWTTTGHILTNALGLAGVPTRTAVWLLALLDPVLLALVALATGLAFGLETLALFAIYLTANPLVLYDYTGGAFLRQDWLGALLIGLCAFRLGRPALAGVLLAYSAGTRMFPAAFLVVPVFLAARTWRDTGRLPSSLRRLFVSAAVSGAALFGLSLAVCGGPGKWVEFLENVRAHDRGAYTNHISFRNAFLFEPARVGKAYDYDWETWRQDKEARLERLKWAYRLGILALTALALVARRRTDPLGALCSGSFLPFVFFYPANYYLNFLAPLVLEAASTSLAALRRIFLVLFAGNLGHLFLVDFDQYTAYLSGVVLVWMLATYLPDLASGAPTAPAPGPSPEVVSRGDGPSPPPGPVGPGRRRSRRSRR